MSTMTSLQEKSWNNDQVSPRKKLLSRLLTHTISRQLDHSAYEVIYESRVDSSLMNTQHPDVVIYRTAHGLEPSSAIELCTTAELTEMSIACKLLFDSSALSEFFLYDYERNDWYFIRKGMDWFRSGCESLLNDLQLQHFFSAINS